MYKDHIHNKKLTLSVLDAVSSEECFLGVQGLQNKGTNMLNTNLSA